MERCLVLLHLVTLCFVDIHRRPALSEIGEDRGVRREGWARDQEERREGKLQPGCKTNKQANKHCVTGGNFWTGYGFGVERVLNLQMVGTLLPFSTEV